MNLRRKQPPPISETAAIVLVLDRHGEPLPLREQPAYMSKLAELEVAEGVRARARQRDERARARQLAPPSKRAAIDRMKDLAAGVTIPGTDPARDREAAAQEELIARQGEMALNGELAELASELSYQFCQRLVAQNRAAMVEIYQCLCQSAAALAALQGLHMKTMALGYQPSVVLLPTHVPAVVYQIGAPDNPNSQLAALRHWLADHEMI